MEEVEFSQKGIITAREIGWYGLSFGELVNNGKLSKSYLDNVVSILNLREDYFNDILSRENGLGSLEKSIKDVEERCIWKSSRMFGNAVHDSLEKYYNLEKLREDEVLYQNPYSKELVKVEGGGGCGAIEGINFRNAEQANEFIRYLLDENSDGTVSFIPNLDFFEENYPKAGCVPYNKVTTKGDSERIYSDRESGGLIRLSDIRERSVPEVQIETTSDLQIGMVSEMVKVGIFEYLKNVKAEN